MAAMAPDEFPDAREWRRAEARARTRRRRAAAFGLLVAVVSITGGVIALASGGSDRGSKKTAAKTVATAPKDIVRASPAGTNAVPPRAPQPSPGQSEPPGRRIPILMYHVVEAAPAGTAYPDLWVPGDRFRAEMAMLSRKGFNGITMRDAYDYWKRGRRIPKHPVVLTFDDGYRSQLATAAPVLRQLGWPGVIYLQAGALKTRGAEGIGKSDVRELLGFGWELGSHTIDHADVTTLSANRLRYEIAYSKEFFQRMFKVPISSFCYPAGKNNHAAVAAVAKAGYTNATTVDEGLGSPTELLRLKRIRVHASDTADTLEKRLAAAGA
jgi:peptidoglycan/xylan/chitin deacetylase (PgdA/CDA1 family)